jgi:hypothetical protein
MLQTMAQMMRLPITHPMPAMMRRLRSGMNAILSREGLYCIPSDMAHPPNFLGNLNRDNQNIKILAGVNSVRATCIIEIC